MSPYCRQCNTVALIPLTLERFAAIVYPFHHRYLFTHRKCLLLALTMWGVKSVYIVIFVRLYVMGDVKVSADTWSRNTSLSLT